MRRTVPHVVVALLTALATVLVFAATVSARPLSQLGLSGVEPDTLVSQNGGTLSIYGTSFTATTAVRLVGFGLLNATLVNNSALQAAVPPGVPAGTYDLEVSEEGSSVTLPSALTVIAATPVPGATPVPTPKPTPVPGRPILTIRNFSVEPTRVAVGREFIVTVEIYNNGSRAGENTLVIFPGGTFLPVDETGHLLGQLHINHTAIVTQRMRVPGGLSSGSYSLQVDLSANDWEGNHYDYPQTIAVEVAGIGHGRPQVVIEAAQTEPAVLGPGDSFSLTLRIANPGNRTATEVLVSAVPSDLAVPASSNVVALDRIAINEVVTATLPLVLGEVTQAGRRSMEIALAYSDYDGNATTDRQSVGLEVSTALGDRPQLIIDSYHTTPDPLTPGDTFTLTMQVSNVGGGEAQRLTLTIGGEAGSGLAPFAPLDSSNVKFIPQLAADDAIDVTQRLIVEGGADAGAYSLVVDLSFDDARGTRHSDSQLISMLVRRRPHFQIGFYRPVPLATIGVPFDLPVEVTNIGRNLVNISTLAVTSEELDISDGSLFVGPLDGGTSGSMEATAVAEKGGTAGILVTVHYLDEFEQPQVVTETMTVEVEEPVVVEEQADEESQEQEGPWDRVLRILRALLGLGS